MEERGDSMALEAEEPGSDKTEVPRGATVSAFAPRSCRVLWRRSDARRKKGADRRRQYDIGARRRYGAKQGAKEHKKRRTSENS